MSLTCPAPQQLAPPSASALEIPMEIRKCSPLPAALGPTTAAVPSPALHGARIASEASIAAVIRSLASHSLARDHFIAHRSVAIWNASRPCGSDLRKASGRGWFVQNSRPACGQWAGRVVHQHAPRGTRLRPQPLSVVAHNAGPDGWWILLDKSVVALHMMHAS